jgi:hypothetical protein
MHKFSKKTLPFRANNRSQKASYNGTVKVLHYSGQVNAPQIQVKDLGTPGYIFKPKAL